MCNCTDAIMKQQSAAGKIYLCLVTDVSTDPIDELAGSGHTGRGSKHIESGPTEFVINITTPTRVYSFCASSAEERDRWVDVVLAHAKAVGGMQAGSSNDVAHQDLVS